MKKDVELTPDFKSCFACSKASAEDSKAEKQNNKSHQVIHYFLQSMNVLFQCVMPIQDVWDHDSPQCPVFVTTPV